MSHVTNVIVLTSVGDVDLMTDALQSVWNAMEREDSPPKPVQDDSVGGSKRLECGMFTGAHNYLDISQFLRLLRIAVCAWNPGKPVYAWPESVAVVFEDQHDERFTFVRLMDAISQQ